MKLLFKKTVLWAAWMIVACVFVGAANAADDIFHATPSEVIVYAGDTVSVTLENNNPNAEADLSTGALNNKVTTYSTEYFTVNYPNGSKLPKVDKNHDGTLTLNVTGLVATPEPQTLTIYKDGNNYSSITITVLPKTVTFQNRDITYSGATCTEDEDNGELVFSFTSEVGTLELPWDAIADYLVVGGGGGGGRSGADAKSNDQFGTSGNGGEVKHDENVVLSAEAFAIQVGAGGSAAAEKSPGGNGGESSLEGTSLSETAAGGTGGYGGKNSNVGGAGTPAAGTESAITGTSTVYGTGGAAAYVEGEGKNAHKVAGEPGAPNTGNGGMGGDGNTASGAGDLWRIVVGRGVWDE